MPGPVRSPTASNPSTTGASSFFFPPNFVCTVVGMSTPVVTAMVSTSSEIPSIRRLADVISAHTGAAVVAMRTTQIAPARRGSIRRSPSSWIRSWRMVEFFDCPGDCREERFDPTGAGRNDHEIVRRKLTIDAQGGRAKNDSFAGYLVSHAVL